MRARLQSRQLPHSLGRFGAGYCSSRKAYCSQAGFKLNCRLTCNACVHHATHAPTASAFMSSMFASMHTMNKAQGIKVGTEAQAADFVRPPNATASALAALRRVSLRSRVIDSEPDQWLRLALAAAAPAGWAPRPR